MNSILLVDDDLVILTSYEKILAKGGYSVIKARDGQEALAKMTGQSFDLILTDLQMPNLSGQKLIEFLQNNEGAAPCPIVISSGFIDGDVIHCWGGHGRVHFLPKPTSAQELLEKVAELLSSTPKKAKVDVRFVNPVLSSTVEVIASMTQFQVSVGKPFLKTDGQPSGDISGVVSVVSSGFKGTISVSFSEAGFLKIVSKMFGAENTEINAENRDAVAELMNIIFGKAKKILNEGGMNIQQAIPVIVHEKNHCVKEHNPKQTLVIPFSSTETGDFRAEVSSHALVG